MKVYCAWWPTSAKSLPSGELVIFLKTSGTWPFISHRSPWTLLCFFTNIIISKYQVHVDVPAVWVQSSPSVLFGTACGGAYRRLQETGQWHHDASGPQQPPGTLGLHGTVCVLKAVMDRCYFKECLLWDKQAEAWGVGNQPEHITLT